VELAARGYDVIGIDNSPQMLAQAKMKAIDRGVNDILFLEQDIDDFELYGTVGAFLSTIDAVNYITDKRRLRRLFRLADNFLSPGGLFIFDVNTVYKLSEDIGNKFFYEISDEVCYLWENHFNKRNNTSTFDLTFFIRGKDGGWSRFDEIHTQRAYTYNDIKISIRETGLEIAGYYGFRGFKRPAGKTAKAVYVLKKSGSGAI
jgi:SAM-dependent methyltransferase